MIRTGTKFAGHSTFFLLRWHMHLITHDRERSHIFVPLPKVKDRAVVVPRFRQQRLVLPYGQQFSGRPEFARGGLIGRTDSLGCPWRMRYDDVGVSRTVPFVLLAFLALLGLTEPSASTQMSVVSSPNRFFSAVSY